MEGWMIYMCFKKPSWACWAAITFNTLGLMDKKFVSLSGNCIALTSDLTNLRVPAFVSGYCMYCASNKIHRIATHKGR